MIAVFKREFKSYFNGIIGYLFAAFLLIFAGIYTMAYNLRNGYTNFEYVLDSITFIFMIAIPVLTMRSMAEDKRQKTDQLLYSAPVKMTGVVMGKYFAMLAVLLVPCLVMAVYPIILSNFGTVNLPQAYGALVAFFLLGATLISMGLFISAMTESQVAAAVITLVATLIIYFMTALSSFVSTDAGSSAIALCVLAAVFGLILWLMTKNPIVSIGAAGVLVAGILIWYNIDSTVFQGLFGNIMDQLGLFDRFDTFVDGVFDVTGVVYYLSICAVFLFLTVQAMEKRRWSE